MKVGELWRIKWIDKIDKFVYNAYVEILSIDENDICITNPDDEKETIIVPRSALF